MSEYQYTVQYYNSQYRFSCTEIKMYFICDSSEWTKTLIILLPHLFWKTIIFNFNLVHIVTNKFAIKTLK